MMPLGILTRHQACTGFNQPTINRTTQHDWFRSGKHAADIGHSELFSILLCCLSSRGQVGKLPYLGPVYHDQNLLASNRSGRTGGGQRKSDTSRPYYVSGRPHLKKIDTTAEMPRLRGLGRIYVPSQIKASMRRKIPTVVLLRHPLDAIKSVMIIDKSPSIRLAIWSYVSIYRTATKTLLPLLRLTSMKQLDMIPWGR